MAETDKATVARVLRNMARMLELKGESAYKIRAYDLGADRIAGLTDDLRVLVQEKRLKELPGIGGSLEVKVAEIVQTGKLAAYEALRSEFPPNILEMIQLPELGPRKAALLWKELGIGNLDALERACLEQRVRTVKGFGTKSEERILENLRAFRSRPAGEPERRLLAHALPIADRLLTRIAQLPGVKRSSVAGSLRRFCETVSDIDLVASATNPLPVLEAFAHDPDVTQVLGQGESKCSVKLYDGLQVDLRVLPDEDFATALHHFTGSRSHHIRLRGRAQERGIRLSEWGAFEGERKLDIAREEDLYALLDMQYVPPELREDWGEYEAAIEGTLPPEDALVSTGAIRGAVHSHSQWSDGKATLEEMARAARDSGLEYLTVTEHSQAASYAGGLTVDDLKRQWEEIDRLNEVLAPFRLLKGIEADILQSGALDYSSDVLEQLDLVIGSIHVRHQMDEEQMTRRVLAAMDNPYLSILGHLTGRLIQSRPPYALRLDEVFEKAAARGVVIEVNGSPERLDLKAEHVRRALSHGVKLVCSVDAHNTGHLGHIRLAVATARKGWARKTDVLNTLTADAFLKRLRALRREGGRAG